MTSDDFKLSADSPALSLYVLEKTAHVFYSSLDCGCGHNGRANVLSVSLVSESGRELARASCSIWDIADARTWFAYGDEGRENAAFSRALSNPSGEHEEGDLSIFRASPNAHALWLFALRASIENPPAAHPAFSSFGDYTEPFRLEGRNRAAFVEWCAEKGTVPRAHYTLTPERLCRIRDFLEKREKATPAGFKQVERAAFYDTVGPKDISGFDQCGKDPCVTEWKTRAGGICALTIEGGEGVGLPEIEKQYFLPV